MAEECIVREVLNDKNGIAETRLMHAHMPNDLKIATGDIPDLSVQPLRFTEASSARGVCKFRSIKKVAKPKN